MSKLVALSALLIVSAAPVAAQLQDVPPPAADVIATTGEDLLAVITQIDEDAQVTGNGAQFQFNERDFILVFDENAGRMRLMTPVAPAAALGPDLLERVLQANYDAVLDARYALANDLLWSVFLHPLPSLTQRDFISGLAQTATAAETFGTSFTSGAVVFGGGDSAELHEDLLRELEDALNPKRDI
ncbi:MAG: hypothetical protein AAFQ67_05615 [Pseudomonadota bacterium]